MATFSLFLLGKKTTAARFFPSKMMWFTRAELPRVLPPKMTLVQKLTAAILDRHAHFFAIGKSSTLLTESKGFLYYSCSCYLNLASLLQLEKERKEREERQKRDAEEAAERQRREEEWVRTNHWQLIRARFFCQR